MIIGGNQACTQMDRRRAMLIGEPVAHYEGAQPSGRPSWFEDPREA